MRESHGRKTTEGFVARGAMTDLCKVRHVTLHLVQEGVKIGRDDLGGAQ